MAKKEIKGGIKTYNLTPRQERDLYNIAKKNGHNTLRPFVEMVLINISTGNIVNIANLIQENCRSWDESKQDEKQGA